MRLAWPAAALAASLAIAATAPETRADNRLVLRDGQAHFVSEDPGIDNELVIDPAANGEVRFYEPRDPQGIGGWPGDRCRPGRLGRRSLPIEIFCRRSAIASLSVGLGPAEDRLAFALADLPSSLAGEDGADNLTGGAGPDAIDGGQGNDSIRAGAGDDDAHGGDGDDTLDGGEGNDKMHGGTGADTLDGGAGDDVISGADGEPDRVLCGGGNDTAIADPVDTPVDCENVMLRQVAAPHEPPIADDGRPPRMETAGSTSQRLRPRIVIAVKSSEPGVVHVAGYLAAGGLNLRLRPVVVTIAVGGGAVELSLALSRRQRTLATRDLPRGRHPSVRLTASATDRAGNTSAARHLKIALR